MLSTTQQFFNVQSSFGYSAFFGQNFSIDALVTACYIRVVAYCLDDVRGGVLHGNGVGAVNAIARSTQE